MRIPANPLPAWAYDPFKGAGRVMYAHPDKVVWGLFLDDRPIATCVQTDVQPILDRNAETAADNAGKRWGDGQVAARIPLDLYYAKFQEARLNQDEKYIRKLLSDIDYGKLRTFGKGSL